MYNVSNNTEIHNKNISERKRRRKRTGGREREL
jgi:hypothetical protein